jgi:predicted DCC family thiol-disulfide oxidoreductase YuxK
MVIRRLYVLYDWQCGICSGLRSWIQNQPAFVQFDFVPAGSPRAQRLFPTLSQGGTPSELVVITDSGAVYADNDAWILCLWGLREYRDWSYRLARGVLRPFARAAWDFLSTNRLQLASMMALKSDAEVAGELAQRPGVTCDTQMTR